MDKIRCNSHPEAIRAPEPSLVMISERLGYSQPGPEPAIDSQYLTELTSRLPEFVIFDPG